MRKKTESYGQPEKRRARSVVLRHAIESLTTNRDASPLATSADFDSMLEYCLGLIEKYCKQDLREKFQPIRDEWQGLHASRVGRRRPDELKVLILSGPEPLNDFEQLAEFGISPNNVWAVEGDRRAYQAAARQLRDFGLPLKLHHGSLHEFFSVVPEQFDIVYFDACGPLFGGKPKTNVVLQELFLHQRLAPLSALITNFAATTRDNEERGQDRLFSWYAARYAQPVHHLSEDIERVHDSGCLYREHVKEHLEAYYSDFVSRFTIEFANQLLAWWRVRALSAAKEAYFSPEKKLKRAVEAAFRVDDSAKMEDLIASIGHARLSPSSYPYMWLVALTKEHLPKDDPLFQLLHLDALQRAKLSDAIEAVSLIQNYFEGYSSLGKSNWNACSDQLADVLGNFKWIDSEGAPWHRLFCDDPLPNLIVDLLLGIYGYPYHTNLSQLRRISYCAKKTTMLSDVFILDQCRYLYDLVPTLPLFGHELPLGYQLLIRICLDLIGRHTRDSCSNLYRGASLASLGEKVVPTHSWPDREELR